MSMPTIFDDPEKGVGEDVIAFPPVSVLPTHAAQKTIIDIADSRSPNGDQKAELSGLPALVPLHKDASPQKPKLRVSRWIRFQLWFTTYRYGS